MNWIPRTLDELGYVSRGKSRHRPRDAAHLYVGPYPFVQTGDIKHSTLYLSTYKQTYSEAGLAQSRLWRAGTLCITIAANIADTAILGMDACFPDSVIGFVPYDRRADVRFIKYLFDAKLQNRFKQFTQGVAQDNLSQSKLLTLKFLVPDVREQRRIADILSAYDDLIENNRRRIALLEQAARELYREWFVRLRFPGYENTRIIDGVPDGWEKVSFAQLAEFVNGYAFKPAQLGNVGLPIIKIPELKSGITAKTPRNPGDLMPTKYHIHDGDLLFSWSGTLAVNVWTSGDALLNQHLFVVKPTDRVSRGLLMFALREARASFDNQTVGATMRHIRRSALDTVTLCLPAYPLLKAFECALSGVWELIIFLSKQNIRLTEARDLLLPRLMSGKVAV